ncbi:pentapeptide repeat-containing protein [Streptomyces xylophagus]|uniref:pentapeptide repeat-containing protein n=1 Tax=Streptomyces xylophagus TaxID=285514 RepID=UPI0009986DF3|nr:pentapeptide repeat-containing protein [Streptomyces xylophagus]
MRVLEVAIQSDSRIKETTWWSAMSTPTGNKAENKLSKLLILTVALAVIFLGITFLFLFWRGPELIDGIDPGNLGKDDGPKATTVAGLRTALAAALVGIVGIGTLLLTTATYFTNRRKDRDQFDLAQEQFNHAQEAQKINRDKDEASAALAREGQITDRYVKAVTLLDSDKITARMAGVYALDRIMRDSAKDHLTIVQLLAGFIRQRAAIVGDWDAMHGDDSVPAEHVRIADDVQAALTVIGKRPVRSEESEIDLRRTYLRGANLIGARLNRALFVRCDLSGAELIGAQLYEANFYKARLNAVYAPGVNLIKAHMAESYISGTLSGAKMKNVNLNEAQLSAIDLEGASLNGAFLDGAHLTHGLTWDELSGDQGLVRVEINQLLEAVITSKTKLPEEFLADPELVRHIAKCDSDLLF